MKKITLSSLFDGSGGFPIAATLCGIEMEDISENGVHCVCTLSSKTATKCLTGENDSFYDQRKEKKLMTNADRIRSMSDEELAEFICAVSDDDEGAKMVECHYFPAYSIYDILEWLQQPWERE